MVLWHLFRHQSLVLWCNQHQANCIRMFRSHQQPKALQVSRNPPILQFKLHSALHQIPAVSQDSCSSGKTYVGDPMLQTVLIIFPNLNILKSQYPAFRRKPPTLQNQKLPAQPLECTALRNGRISGPAILFACIFPGMPVCMLTSHFIQ